MYNILTVARKHLGEYCFPHAILAETASLSRYEEKTSYFSQPIISTTAQPNLNILFTFPTVIYNRGKVLESAQEISKISSCFVCVCVCM